MNLTKFHCKYRYKLELFTNVLVYLYIAIAKCVSDHLDDVCGRKDMFKRWSNVVVFLIWITMFITACSSSNNANKQSDSPEPTSLAKEFEVLDVDQRWVIELLDRAMVIHDSTIEYKTYEVEHRSGEEIILQDGTGIIEMIWGEKPNFYKRDIDKRRYDEEVIFQQYVTPQGSYYNIPDQWFKSDAAIAPIFVQDYSLRTTDPYAQLRMLLQYTSQIAVEEHSDKYRIILTMGTDELNNMFIHEGIFTEKSIIKGASVFTFEFDKQTAAPQSFKVDQQYEMDEIDLKQAIEGTFSAHNAKKHIIVPEEVLKAPYNMD